MKPSPNADIVIAYRILLEMTEDEDTLREIARQAHYDWRMDRRTAMKIIVIATDRLLAARRASNAVDLKSQGT